MLVPWTTLQPSRRAQRWRQVGLGIALAASLALLCAAIASAPFSAGLALLAGIAGLVAWAATRERPMGCFEIGVSAVGEVKLRERTPQEGAGALATAPVRIGFASPWLISLRRGTMLIPIWPDSLPRPIFRRLWVHLRWGRTMPNDDDRQSTPTDRGKFMDR